MKIAVTDASIFIDLINLGITDEFFGLTLDVHTTVSIINELYPEQQHSLNRFRLEGKITVHVLTGEEQFFLMGPEYPRGLSLEDRSVIFIAKKLGDALVLSSDKLLRRHAGKLSIEYHGMIWILDQLVAEELVAIPDAIAKIKAWMNSNVIYLDNPEIKLEVEKRLKDWSA